MIPRHSKGRNPPSIFGLIGIPTPSTLCSAITRWSIPDAGSVGLPLPQPATSNIARRRGKPSETVTSWLLRPGQHGLEVTTRPYAHAAPVHAAYPRDTLGRVHLEMAGGKVDAPE